MKRYILLLVVSIINLLQGCSGGSSTSSTAPTEEANSCLGIIAPEVPKSSYYENTIFPSPPSGYKAILGWVVVINGNIQNGTSGKAIIQKVELWEKEGATERLIADRITCTNCSNPEDKVWGFLWPKSQWLQDTAWSATNNGTAFLITQEGYVEVNPGENPDKIYHFWNTYDPRPSTKPTATYYVKATAKIEGNAMVQIGFDYYKETSGGSPQEGAYSKWHCSSTSGWQEIKAGAYK